MANSSNSRVKYAMNFYTRLGYQPHQAAGIVGNLLAESGLNPNVRPGDNGTAFGIAQWRGNRFTGLQQYAASMGKDWRDLDVQLGYVHHELNTTERAAGQRIRAARNAQEANDGMISFERPFGSNKGAHFAHNYSGRLNFSNQVLASWQGGNGGGSTIMNGYMPQQQPSQGEQAIDDMMTGSVGNGATGNGGNGNYPRYVRQWTSEGEPPADVFIDPSGRYEHIYGAGGQLDIGRQNEEMQKQWEELEAKESGRYELVPANKAEDWQKNWKEQNQNKGIAGDTWDLLGSGVDALESSIEGAFRIIPGYKTVSDWWNKFLNGKTYDEIMRDNKEWRDARYSDPMQEARNKNWIDVDEKTGEWNVGDAVSDWRSLGRVAKAAGLEDVSAHVLRHTAAVWMAEAGIAMEEISQYLGHANTSITERVYARYSPDYLRSTASALEIGDNVVPAFELKNAPKLRARPF